MQDEPKKPKMAADWDKDSFPTSAKPIFKSWAMLVLLIGAICAYLYFSSDRREPAEPVDDKRERIRSELLADEQNETIE